MESIWCILDDIIEVKNYVYSPYLLNMVNTNVRVDKYQVRNTIVYDLKVITELFPTEDIISYFNYLSSGSVSDPNLELYQYMGHTVKDLINLKNDDKDHPGVSSEYIPKYIEIKLEDTWIRDNMYRLELYKDPLYGLEQLVRVIKNKIDIDKNIENLTNLFGNDRYVMAGGYPLALLTNQKYNDIDLFFCGDDCDNAIKKIKEHARVLYVSSNSIQFEYNKVNYQLILRKYKAITEILHGFDVDCCGVMINAKKKFYVTSRAEHAIIYKVNMFDYTRMSESYPYRMKKYYSRGYNVMFPNWKLVKSILHKYEAYLTKYINLTMSNSHNVDMSPMVKNRKYWQDKLEVAGIEPNFENLTKVCLMLTHVRGKKKIKIKGLNSASMSIFLVPKYEVVSKRISDYSKGGKGKEFNINNIVWKEQDPMTQVTGTFNPEIYDSFESFIETHNLDILTL